MREACEVTVVAKEHIPSITRFIDFFAEAVEQCRNIGETHEIEVVLMSPDSSDTIHVNATIPDGIRDFIHTTASLIDRGYTIVAIVFRA